MASITIHNHDLLPHDGDVWVNVVGEFRQLDGVTTEDLLLELVDATDGTGCAGADWVRVTCVADVTPARTFRRLAGTVLRDLHASAEASWHLEIAPSHLERLGAP